MNSLSYRCTCVGWCWKMAILPSNTAPPLGIKVRHFTVITAEYTTASNPSPVYKRCLEDDRRKWATGRCTPILRQTPPKRFRCAVDHIDFQCTTLVWVPEGDDKYLVRMRWSWGVVHMDVRLIFPPLPWNGWQTTLPQPPTTAHM